MNIGVLGYGDIADLYFLYLNSIRKMHPVVAVCDIAKDRARQAADKYDIPVWYDCFNAFCSDTNVDVVVNLTPPRAHFETNHALLEASKHIYSEKPLALKTSECQKLISVAKKNSCKVACAPSIMLGGTMRWVKYLFDRGNYGWQRAASARLGPATSAFVQFGSGVGGHWFVDRAVYGLTALTEVFGPARRVFAFGKGEYPRILSSKEMTRGVTEQTPLQMSIMLEFDGGNTGFLFAGQTFEGKLPHMIVVGKGGYVHIPNIWSCQVTVGLYSKDSESNPEDKVVKASSPWPFGSGMSLPLGIGDLISAIENDSVPLHGPEQATHLVEIAEKAEVSAKTGKSEELETSFPYPKPQSYRWLTKEMLEEEKK